MGQIAVQITKRDGWPAIAAAWERVHAATPDASFLLSRVWVERWLATFGPSLEPELVTFVHAGTVVGCCLLVTRTQWTRGVPVRSVYLNCAGEDERDTTCAEYNTLLVEPAHAHAAADALARVLRWRYWDELVLPGLTATSPVRALIGRLGASELVARPSHYLDLVALRTGGGAGSPRAALDAALSSNTRQQIRRSQRLYEQRSGPCTLRVATTPAEAFAMFDRLATLHQTAWRARGEPGVFASKPFTAFHRGLISASFARGSILLAELVAGSTPIGALYSFVDGGLAGRLYFYQSGFAYEADPKLKPGLLTHYHTILHCLDHTQITDYDFLAGDSQYKRSLASAERELAWVIVRRPTLPNLMRHGLRLARQLYARFKDTGPADAPSRGH